MEFVLFAILLIVCALSFLEDRLQQYNRMIYSALSVVLILFAGLREVGFDRDSGNYDIYFINYDDPAIELVVEYSFRLLARIVHFFSDDVHWIFMFYAILGITLKMVAFRRLSKFWFLPLTVYLGNYYILHDLTQMRASVVAGLTFLAIPFIQQGRRKEAFGLFALGCVFHYSTLALLPAAFLSANDMGKRERWIWAAIIPLGYLAYFAQFNMATMIYIPYITDKIELYENLRDKGIAGDEINVFNLVFLVKCVAYIYILYFYDTVRHQEKYLPLMLRFMGISIFMFLFFAQLPVLSFRISELYGVVEIFIFTYILYTISPTWLGRMVVCAAAVSLFVINIFSLKILESV